MKTVVLEVRSLGEALDDTAHAPRAGEIWQLTLYPKSVAENTAAHVLRQIKDEIDG